jgi:putative endopeptidase
VIKTAKILKGADAQTMSDYMRWSIVRSFAEFDLPRAFADQHFAFFETALKGTKEQKPRWKRAMQQVESVMGEALGELYVAKYFSVDAKGLALDVVERVRNSLRERLLEVDWLSDATKRKAILKMNNFGVKIGFPDKWIDYTELQVVKS